MQQYINKNQPEIKATFNSAAFFIMIISLYLKWTASADKMRAAMKGIFHALFTDRLKTCQD